MGIKPPTEVYALIGDQALKFLLYGMMLQTIVPSVQSFNKYCFLINAPYVTLAFA